MKKIFFAICIILVLLTTALIIAGLELELVTYNINRVEAKDKAAETVTQTEIVNDDKCIEIHWYIEIVKECDCETATPSPTGVPSTDAETTAPSEAPTEQQPERPTATDCGRSDPRNTPFETPGVTVQP